MDKERSEFHHLVFRTKRALENFHMVSSKASRRPSLIRLSHYVTCT